MAQNIKEKVNEVKSLINHAVEYCGEEDLAKWLCETTPLMRHVAHVCASGVDGKNYISSQGFSMPSSAMVEQAINEFESGEAPEYSVVHLWTPDAYDPDEDEWTEGYWSIMILVNGTGEAITDGFEPRPNGVSEKTFLEFFICEFERS